jgi:biopolymer transport protein ExbD
MKSRHLIALFAIGLCADALADSRKDYPQIAMVAPSSGNSPVDRERLVLLVVEGPFISHEQTPIQADRVVSYVNELLRIKGVSYVGVYSREGVKYGDVVRALDTLSLTNAKNIGVSMLELPVGKEP